MKQIYKTLGYNLKASLVWLQEAVLLPAECPPPWGTPGTSSTEGPCDCWPVVSGSLWNEKKKKDRFVSGMS